MNGVQTFRQKQKLNPAILDKLLKSREETETLSIRDIRCPFCGYLVEKVFSDISGHIFHKRLSVWVFIDSLVCFMSAVAEA